MGDRFYTDDNMKPRKYPAEGKPAVKRLKAVIVSDINELLETQVSGMNKLTVKSLNELEEAICQLINS